MNYSTRKNTLPLYKVWVSLIFLVLCIFKTDEAMAIEEPKYQTLLTDQSFEVRKYAPYVTAETTVQADMDKASNQGFRRIADFIFGNNRTVTQPGSEKENNSAKIAMTAPVVVEPLAQVQDPMVNANEWRISFVMPSQYNEQTLPKPNNKDVVIRTVPEKYYAVLNYSWLNGTEKVQEKSDELLKWIQKNNLKSMGQPKLARYDPPWTLPMFRRNEILIEIEPPSTLK